MLKCVQHISFFSQSKFYEVLKLPKNATKVEIKERYYELAKIYHPDVNPEQIEYFQAISQAYQELSQESDDGPFVQEPTQNQSYNYYDRQFTSTKYIQQSADPDMKRIYEEYLKDKLQERQQRINDQKQQSMRAEKVVKRATAVASPDMYETLQSSNKRK